MNKNFTFLLLFSIYVGLLVGCEGKSNSSLNAESTVSEQIRTAQGEYENDFLNVEGTASYDEVNKDYLVEVNVTNISRQSIILINDCGNPIMYETKPDPTINACTLEFGATLNPGHTYYTSIRVLPENFNTDDGKFIIMLDYQIGSDHENLKTVEIPLKVQ